MSDSKFKWSDDALSPDSLEMVFPGSITPTGEDVKVTQWELSRPDVVAFIQEGFDRTFTHEVDQPDGTKEKKQLPFADIVKAQETLLWKYLAKSSRGAQDEKFYKSLTLGAKGLIALVDAFMHLNHLEEIMASGGNWFLLPTIRSMSEAEEEGSESPKPTTEA